MCHVFISPRFNLSHLSKRTTAESRNKYHWRSVQIIWRTAARRYHLILCWFYNEFHFFDNSDKASGSGKLLSILSNKLQYSLNQNKTKTLTRMHLKMSCLTIVTFQGFVGVTIPQWSPYYLIRMRILNTNSALKHIIIRLNQYKWYP